jgi:hypothetical protein
MKLLVMSNERPSQKTRTILLFIYILDWEYEWVFI